MSRLYKIPNLPPEGPLLILDHQRSLEPGGKTILESLESRINRAQTRLLWLEREVEQAKQDRDAIRQERDATKREILEATKDIRAKANEILQSAETNAKELTSQAQEQAKELIAHAQEQTKELIAQAQEQAEKLTTQAKEQGYQQGYENGQKEGLKSGYEEGKTTGMKAATQESEKLLSATKNETEALMAKTQEQATELINTTQEQTKRLILEAENILLEAKIEREKIIKETKSMLIDLCLLMAKKVVKVECQRNKNVILKNLEEALKKVKGQEEMTIRVNFSDLKCLEGHKKRLISSIPKLEGIRFEEDETVEPGGCKIETNFGFIDARIKTQIENLEERLYEGAADLNESHA